VHYPELLQFGVFSLLQMGDLSCDSYFELYPHTNVCYEISYVVSGRGWFSNDGNRYEVQAGDIHLIRPGEVHGGGADAKDPYRYMYLGFYFNPSLDEENPYRKIREAFDRKQTTHCTSRLDLLTPFVSAIKESGNSDRLSREMIEMYLKQIIVLTYRNFLSDWEAKYPLDGLDNEAKRVVYAAIHYIDEHLLDIKDLREIAAAFGYSYSHFSNLFSKETGESLRNYYMKRKWAKAVELLKDGNRSITEIARMVHYDSIHTFSRAFRKEYGISPTKFKRTLNGL
jgi:AraC-like DNA-binding protein